MAVDRFWRSRAACAEVDPELFFPRLGGNIGQRVERARRICAGCPVRVECLGLAQAECKEHGVFAGLTVKERKALRSRRVVRPVSGGVAS
jgi:WhiB family transcriptional regulator, redox-sensing transcriptional regulator